MQAVLLRNRKKNCKVFKTILNLSNSKSLIGKSFETNAFFFHEGFTRYSV